ncbi:MAG: alcohol dehydrogenase catalytic domain-containing protein [Bryobacteraceae bacterium]
MKIETKAAVLPAAQQPVEIRNVEVSDPPAGHVRVRMEACGICHSDLFVAGLPKLPLQPLTLGHEGIGVVESAGPDAGEWAAGDRVGITFLGSTCGECEYCRTGRERFCPKQKNTGYTVNGALAGYAIAAAHRLVRVPKALPAHEAAPLCCAGWTAYGALREAELAAGQSVAIFGFGGLGHLALQYARNLGVRAIVADIAESKLERARSHGAELAVLAEEGGRQIQKQAGGVDAAIVFTASPAAIEQAFRAVKRNGTVVLVGLANSSFTLPIADTILKGIRLRGSFLGTKDDLEAVFRQAETGEVKAETERHELEETPRLLERLLNHDVQGRAVVVF